MHKGMHYKGGRANIQCICVVHMQVRDLLVQTVGQLSAAYAACRLESCAQTVHTTVLYLISI
jgi:hypothetical protein